MFLQNQRGSIHWDHFKVTLGIKDSPRGHPEVSKGRPAGNQPKALMQKTLWCSHFQENVYQLPTPTPKLQGWLIKKHTAQKKKKKRIKLDGTSCVYYKLGFIKRDWKIHSKSDHTI